MPAGIQDEPITAIVKGLSGNRESAGLKRLQIPVNGPRGASQPIGKVGNGFTRFGCNQGLDDLPLPA
jgi:hypothetical protein